MLTRSSGAPPCSTTARRHASRNTCLVEVPHGEGNVRPCLTVNRLHSHGAGCSDAQHGQAVQVRPEDARLHQGLPHSRSLRAREDGCVRVCVSACMQVGGVCGWGWGQRMKRKQ